MGQGALFYRIIHRRMVRQVHTGCRLRRCEWDDATESAVSTGDETRTAYLRSIQGTLALGKARISQIIGSLDRAGTAYTPDDVVSRYIAPGTVAGFMSYSRQLIIDLGKIGKKRLAEHYTTALNRFAGFHGDVEVAFADFDADLMLRFECYLMDHGLCPNSVSYYMRNLRAIYNRAAVSGLTEQRNPFRHVYTGIAKTAKRAVAIDVVKMLRGMDLARNPRAELARDLFLFSFYTRGMSIVDMAFLRKSDLNNGVLTYSRHKTGRRMSVKWVAQMQQIVERHTRSDSDFMFPIIDPERPEYYKQYRMAYNKMLRSLKSLGNVLGLTEPLTFHRSRHSWASIARANNVPLSVISEGMGHDSEKTTRIYLASLDTSVVDRANSDIIRLLDG